MTAHYLSKLKKDLRIGEINNELAERNNELEETIVKFEKMKQTQYNSEELYLLLLVPSAVQTVLSISQNGISQITVNKQLSNHLNKDIINASTNLPLKEPSPNYLIQSFNLTEAVCLVRCLGRSQLISSLSPLVNKLFGGILSWAQTLIRSFTDRQELGTSWEQISYIDISRSVF